MKKLSILKSKLTYINVLSNKTKIHNQEKGKVKDKINIIQIKENINKRKSMVNIGIIKEISMTESMTNINSSSIHNKIFKVKKVRDQERVLHIHY